MMRMRATLLCDLRLQFRNGFYYAAAFVALASIGLLRWLNPDTLRVVMPALILSNLLVNGFYFIGGLILLEKREGTPQAVIVTPLRRTEYLTSKVITLSLLSMAENLLIVVFTLGFGFNLLPLLGGIVLTTGIYALFGFLVVIRYNSINEYLLPSVVYTAFLPLPLLDYFELWQTPILTLHPMSGPLLALKAGFAPVPVGELAFGALTALVWMSLLFRLSVRTFHRFAALPTAEG